MNNRPKRTPAQNAWDYMEKHLKSIHDAVEQDDFSKYASFLDACQNAINYIEIIQVCAGGNPVHLIPPLTKQDVARKLEFDVKTYRDVVLERYPNAQSSSASGGILGCPGSYFIGANSTSPNSICGPCNECWNSPYRGEAWRGSEEGKAEE